MAAKKKFSIIVFSGDYDKAFAAFTIASGAGVIVGGRPDNDVVIVPPSSAHTVLDDEF